ncbi:MAG: hypothetical protein ACKVS6_17365 [Planctomycetota bacterium]
MNADRSPNLSKPGDVDPARAMEMQKAKNPSLEFMCSNLRTKTMFYAFNREQALQLGPMCDTQTFWCVMTGTAIGPDNDVANREECGAHRSCCNK